VAVGFGQRPRPSCAVAVTLGAVVLAMDAFTEIEMYITRGSNSNNGS
jgi:hypothetical protein